MVFPSSETGLILRCAGKAGNPFQTTQGNRLSCRDQEGMKAETGWEITVSGSIVMLGIGTRMLAMELEKNR